MPITTLDPTGARSGDHERRSQAARRPLAGARVGLVSNGLGRTELLLQSVHGLLGEQAGVADAFLVCKPHRSVPPSPEDWERLVTQADVVITGFGGCGSCSTRTVRDAMELEWAGVPSVAVVHEDMLPGVKAMTRLSGMPNYRYVVVASTRTSLCDWDDATIDAVAREVANAVRALLEAPVDPGPATDSEDTAAVVRWQDAETMVEEIRPLLRADDADLELLQVSAGGMIDLRLVLDDVNCLECVLPPELLGQMVTDHIRRALPACRGVRLHDPRVAPPI